MLSHQNLRLLSYFVEIVRAESIRGAAARLSLSPAVLSEALSELEAGLGVTLIKRSTRSMSLTETGAVLFDHASSMVSAASEAMTVGSDAGQIPRGTIRITVPTELCFAFLPPHLKSFREIAPQVDIEVTAEDRQIELTTSKFDLALRAILGESSSSASNVCASLPLELVCTPDLIATDKRETLSQRFKRMGFVGPPNDRRNYRIIRTATDRGTGRKFRDIEAPCRFAVNNHVVAHRLALEGFGAALLLSTTVNDDLAAKRLARVSEDHSFGWIIVSVVARDRHPKAAAQAFRSFLLQEH